MDTNRTIDTRVIKQRIFIGSSSENLSIARAIQAELDHVAFTTIWSQDIFKLTSTALDDLLIATNNFHFAIFIFNPNDITKLRGKEYQTVRDNVIFELGLFLGRLNNRKRVFLLKPRSVKEIHLPTDLAGVTLGDYDDTRTDNLQAAVAPFCMTVNNQINDLKNNGILSLRGKWTERWWVDEPEKEPAYNEDNDVTMEQFDDIVMARFKFDGRTYLFEGKIEQMRFITGSWRDVEVGHTYSGAFQLKININANTLYGKWVGFNASNNSIRTGIWEWKREHIERYPSEHRE